jgi:hypothetical protein
VPVLRASIPVAVVYRRKAYLSDAARNLLAMIPASAPAAKDDRGTSGAKKRRATRKSRS